MNDTKPPPATSNDELEIRKLIEPWAKAVREENRGPFGLTMTQAF